MIERVRDHKAQYWESPKNSGRSLCLLLALR